jgi:replicative DNA helicase
MSNKVPYNQTLEKRVISGLLKYGGDVWPDISPFLTIKDFYSSPSLPYSHRPIFSVIQSFLIKKEAFDHVLVSERLKATGVSFSNINIALYLEELSHSLLTKEAFIQCCRELLKVRVRRELFLSFANTANYIISKEAEDDGIDSILGKCDSEYVKAMGSLGEVQKDAESLTDGLYEFVEGLSQKETSGILLTPFNKFNEIFGGFRLKDSYCFAGRPGHGKSALLQWVAYSTANLVPQNFHNLEPIPVLCIDTEMESDEQRVRLAACIAGVDPFLIETGKWKFDQGSVDRVRGILPTINKHKYDHIYAPRFTVEELVSYVRRWVYKNVGKQNPGIIVFDYLKLSGDDLKNVSDSRLSVAYKLDRIKDLVKEETNCTLLFGAQRNRYSDNDDDGSIAESDHIQRLSNWVGIFKEKNTEELADQPERLFGTHALIPAKSRKLGIAGSDFRRKVKVNGKYLTNWINFRFDNFKYIELNTGKDVENFLNLNPNSP